MSIYNENEIAAAYSVLSEDVAIEKNVSETDIDGLGQVSGEVEDMLINELRRQGVSLKDATAAVHSASIKTGRANANSNDLVEKAKANRFDETPEDDEVSTESVNEIDQDVTENESTANVSTGAATSKSASQSHESANEAPNMAEAPAVKVITGERAQKARLRKYTVENKRISDVFTAIPDDDPMFNFEVPYFTWEESHPNVPAVDKAYNMEAESLATVLYAIANKKSTAIVGPHGAGKTKLVEQVGARLNMPVITVPVDGQITRSELFGQEKIRSTPSGPESYFQYGIIPNALSEPCILLFDEIDRADPSIQYACHSIYEGTHLLLMEHDGRRIPLNKYNRVFATANTKGRGSDDGMYGGDNEMSEATRDRFSLWLEIDYQDPDADNLVLKAKIPDLDAKCRKLIAKASESIRNSFKQEQLSQTCSMRQMLETAEHAVHLIKTSQANDEAERLECLRKAIKTVILNRANEQDKVSINTMLVALNPALDSY